MKKFKRKSKLKWGVAGCGKFTEYAFLPTIQLLRKNQVVSLFSHDKKRADELAGKFDIQNAFSNYDDFLNSGIDCIYVASSNAHHREQVIKAAGAGKHVLCEKPLAITSKDAEEMVNACKENNVQLAVNYVYRFNPLVRKAKELIDKQYIGKIISINLNFNINFLPGNNFRYNKALSGGGALRDLGTHMIDLLRFFGGEIKVINGFMDKLIYKTEVDDFAAAIVHFENGGYGYFNVSFNNKKAFNRIEILGHYGALSFEKLIGSRNATSKLTILKDGEAKKSFRKRAGNFHLLLKSVQNSFLKNETPLVTGYDGLVNMKLMEELESKCMIKEN
ncbi:MAG: gfo/Idh/MocA family oxidoreductase [Ignavibacteriales bacterium]|nr:MAG: gfo/Idh/MocA family oxidoreductase [Ignavibacteriales bacterium]